MHWVYPAVNFSIHRMYNSLRQWRRQRGADGARAPPFCVSWTPKPAWSPWSVNLFCTVPHASLLEWCHSMEMWAGPSTAHAYCWWKVMAFFLGKIPSYLAPALALLNGFEPCPSQNPGYATVRDWKTTIFGETTIIGSIRGLHVMSYSLVA